jgi:hypothetical protein
MKKAIELLKQVKHKLRQVKVKNDDFSAGWLGLAEKSLDEAIKELEATPRWETPEQWEKRTGEPWPDNGAVYYRDRGWHDAGQTGWCLWRVMSHKEAVKKPHEPNCSGVSTADFQIICATEAGKPPDECRPGLEV